MLDKYIKDNVYIGPVTLDIFIVLCASIHQFGYIVSALALCLAAFVGLLSHGVSVNGVGGGRGPCSGWLRLVDGISQLGAACLALSFLLHYGDTGSTLTFIPSATLPSLLPITTIVLLALLFCLGLEVNHVVDYLLKLCLLLGVLLFLVTGATLVELPTQGINKTTPPDFIPKVVQGGAFLSKCFAKGRKSSDLRMTLTKFSLYALILLVIISIPNPKCEIFGLVCPPSLWYGWYTPLMVCLGVVCLGLATLPLYSTPLRTLTKPPHLLSACPQIALENRTTGTHVNAILLVGLLGCLSVYLGSLYQLITLSSGSILLGQTFDLIYSINKQFQPMFVPKNLGRKRMRSYMALRKEDKICLVEEQSCQPSDSSDTDIDSVVAEYKHTLRVKALNYNKFDREPCVESGRAVTGLLSAQLVLAALSSLAFAMAHYTVAFSILPVIFVLMCVVWKQPQDGGDKRRLSLARLLLSALYLQLSILLFLHVLQDVAFPIIASVTAGWVVSRYFEERKKRRRRKAGGGSAGEGRGGPFIIGESCLPTPHTTLPFRLQPLTNTALGLA